MCQVPVNYRALKCPLGHAAITVLFHKTQAAEPTTLIREQNKQHVSFILIIVDSDKPYLQPDATQIIQYLSRAYT